MIYNAREDAETTPPDRLPLDVIYLAVRRLMEGEGAEPASAPTVVVINLSLGDLNRPFAGRIQPLGASDRLVVLPVSCAVPRERRQCS